MSEFVRRLHGRARARHKRIVFPESLEPRTLSAVAELQRDDLVEPVLVGTAEEVAQALQQAGGDPQVEVLDPTTDVAMAEAEGDVAEHATSPEHASSLRALAFAAHLVRSGRVAGSVAGAASRTADVVRTALHQLGAAPGIRTVSSSFYMVVSGFRDGAEEVLTFTDAGVVPAPDVPKLVDIACAAAEARRRIVGDEPVVAFLSYSTLGSAEGESVTLVREAVGRFRQRMPAVAADGELQADAALIPDVAARKAPTSVVAGRANVLVFPSLDAANIAYKLVQRLASAQAFGPILQGLTRPFNDLSRGASVSDIVNVACITALQA